MAGTLQRVCGSTSADGSTPGAGFAAAPGTIFVSPDFWMKPLWGGRPARKSLRRPVGLLAAGDRRFAVEAGAKACAG